MSLEATQFSVYIVEHMKLIAEEEEIPLNTSTIPFKTLFHVPADLPPSHYAPLIEAINPRSAAIEDLYIPQPVIWHQ